LWGGPAGAEILQGRRVTNGYFQILGSKPSQGRLFLPEEYRENGEPVAVLSYGAWLRAFGSDPGIVGKEVSFNGRVHTVVGVMSPDFRTLYGDKIDLWVPVFWRDQNRQGRYFFVIGRLNKSVDIQAA